MADWTSSKYASEPYLQSLAASSRDLQGQVGSALSEIVKQRNLFQEKAAMLPGAIGQAQDAGRVQLHEGLQQLGLGPMSSTLEGVFQGGKDSGVRAAGLIHTGFNEQGAQRQSSALGIGQQIGAGYTQDGNRYVAGRDAEERAREFAAQEAERQRQMQVEMSGARDMQQQGLLQAQAEEEARRREFEAQQNTLNRQNQLSMTTMLAAPKTLIPKAKAVSKPAPTKTVTKVGRYN